MVSTRHRGPAFGQRARLQVYKSSMASRNVQYYTTCILSHTATMIFKVSTIVLAAAALVSASPTIAKRGEATCNINVTGFTFPRSDPPPLPAGETLTTEWNYRTFITLLHVLSRVTKLLVPRYLQSPEGYSPNPSLPARPSP